MELQRYSTEELTYICQKLFINYMLYSKTCFFLGKNFNCAPDENPLIMHHNYLSQVTVSQTCTVNELMSALLDSQTLNDIRQYHRVIEDMEQKSNNYCSKILVDLPLNKKINSYYDDFTLEVVYEYNTTPKEFLEKYYFLSPENRADFFAASIKVVNMSLLMVNNFKLSFLIELVGKGDPRKCSLCLCSKFAGFDKLTLNDIMNIHNNYIRQILQSKIDLDKENLEKVASVDIRGSNYSIFRKEIPLELNYMLEVPKERKYTYFIRYVCPSTQRVYYNEINPRYLALSPYFMLNNYESYARAWWNIIHVGAKCEGTTIISC